jgi:small-conductance mechanosensitive channel
MDGSQNVLHYLAEYLKFGTTLNGVLLSLLTVLALVWIGLLTRRLQRKGYAKLDAWQGARNLALKIQGYEIVSADQVTALLKWCLKIVRYLVLAVLAYIFIPVVLSFFPATRSFVMIYIDTLLVPVRRLLWAAVDFIPNLIFIVFIAFAARYAIKLIRALLGEIQKERISFPGFYREWAEPTFKLLRFIIIVFAVILVSPYLPGFGSPAFQGISIFFGVLLSLSSTAAIANIVAGVALTYMRAFKVGDRVRIADTLGDVIEKTLLITRLRTIKNIEVTIPNSMVLGSHLVNYTSLAEESGLIIQTSVTIGYDAPWRKVHELLIQAALEVEGVLPDPPPFVFQLALNDFSVNYEINAYTRSTSELFRIRSDLHQNIQDKFNEAGVEILSPTYAAVRDGNDLTLPDEYLPQVPKNKGFKFLMK